MDRRRFLRGTLLVIVAAVLGGGLWFGYWAEFQHRWDEPVPGKVYQSGDMPAEDLRKAIKKYGIRSVVDFRFAQEVDNELPPAEEAEVLADLGVQYFHLPSPQVLNEAAVDGFVAAAADENNLPMLIHCHHGEGRSILAVAIYRIEFEGWDREEARRKSKLLSFRGTFAPDGPKGKFLREYERRTPEALTGTD